MKTFKIQFNGRKAGAQGITYPIYKIVLDAENEDKAILSLYDEYEHITNIKILKDLTKE